jgi:Raf kinase inhibitor-like YbhB/YbcL family protein
MSKLVSALVALGVICALAGCGGGGDKISALPGAPGQMKLTSPAFSDGAGIPVRYTCDGADRSPPLAWSDAPKGTSSLALMLADPDAPGGTFVHWTLFDIDPKLTKLAEGAVPSGAVEGENSFGKNGYRGPCPPKGDNPHLYEFAIYALRDKPDLEAGASPPDLRDEIAKLALARGILSGSFGR